MPKPCTLPGPHFTAALLSTSLASQAAAASAKPALLDLPACRKFKQAGPIGFCELKQGSGASPLPGDLIIVDYIARAVANDNEVYDGSRNFKFTVGNGEVGQAHGEAVTWRAGTAAAWHWQQHAHAPQLWCSLLSSNRALHKRKPLCEPGCMII